MTQRNDKVTATVQVGGMINYTPCSIEVGEVTTLPAGSDATVTNSGNEYEAVFDFGIPQGAKGDTGETGATGKSAYESAVEQGYEGTEEEFATSLTTVDTKAAQAAASATAAAGSATSASNSATSASNSATTATTKASEASASATAAAASATSAGSNATAAQNYVTQASTFASNAANSATNAASYASNAASSATNAASMASAASTSASSASSSASSASDSADTASAVLTDPDFVAVAGAVEDISTVATNISDVTSVATSIADVGAVAADLTNIDTAVANLPDLQDKQNKALTNSVILGGETQTTVEGALEAISEEWVKPSEWVDIRSGAVDNSIYFLVGHKADYSAYDSVVFVPTLSTSGHTYSVYIDGLYYNSYSSGATFELKWSTAGITSGRDVTYPESLRTHVIRITPDNIADTITQITSARPANTASNVDYLYGTLWAHFALSNSIKVEYLFARYPSQFSTPLLEAVTAKDDKLTTTTAIRGFLGKGLDLSVNAKAGPVRLSYLPEIDFGNTHSNLMAGTFNMSSNYTGNLKVLRLSNGKLDSAEGSAGGVFAGLKKVKKILCKNFLCSGFVSRMFVNCSSLEELPAIHSTGVGTSIHDCLDVLKGCISLKDTVIDLNWNDMTLPYKSFRLGGSSSERLDGVKGVLVSPTMPFTGTSPQLNVSYTGMDRQALVAMFKSMPYNVKYENVGSVTITDGVASGFSSSKYLSVNINAPLPSNKIEFYTKVTTAASLPSYGYVLRYKLLASDNSGIGITGSNTLGWYLGKDSNNNNIFIRNYGITASANTTYYLKGTIENNIATLYYNTTGFNDSMTTIGSKDLSTLQIATQTETLTYGGSGNSWNGSIDLNNTYVMVNDAKWFNAATSMAKTCSVVGCTGTADLTAEDKAIATDKGWALTLS